VIGTIFNSKKVESIVVLEKDVYRIGETIRAIIHCDNSKSENSVKNFKIKLKRKVNAYGF